MLIPAFIGIASAIALLFTTVYASPLASEGVHHINAIDFAFGKNSTSLRDTDATCYDPSDQVFFPMISLHDFDVNSCLYSMRLFRSKVQSIARSGSVTVRVKAFRVVACSLWEELSPYHRQ